MTSRGLSLLILCNLIWSFHPLLGKMALESFTPANAALLRYGSALIAYLFIALAVQLRPEQGRMKIFVVPRGMKEKLLVFLLGAAPFAFSPILQLTGLAEAQAIDNAILIAMEPVMTVLLAWIVLRERLHLVQWVAFAGAMVGFALLSQIHGVALGTATTVALLPYLLMLISLWGEAAYSVVGRKLVQDHHPLPLYGSAILVGTTLLSLYTAFDTRSGPLLDEISQASSASILSLVYLGPFGTTVSYLIWIRVVRITPVALPALTLFVQPVFGTFLGFMLRDESFNFAQSAGALLILLSVGLQSAWYWKDSRAK